MAAAQTGSNNISAHMTARNKIPTPRFIFSMSPCSTTLSPTQLEVVLYRKYIVGQLGLENMGIAVGILFLAVLCAETVLLPVWAAAISISGTTRLRGNIIDNTVEPLGL